MKDTERPLYLRVIKNIFKLTFGAREENTFASFWCGERESLHERQNGRIVQLSETKDVNF